MLPDKRIIVQMRISPTHPINFLHLSGGKLFVRIETPTSQQQSLPSQDLVNTREAPGKLMLRIEQGGVRIRNLNISRQQFGRYRSSITNYLMHFGK
jgi:hypothetical protein